MVCAQNSHTLVCGCGALRSRDYPMRKERGMAPLSSGVIVITRFRSSGVTGICQGVPVTCQVTCHMLNRLRDSRSYSHSHVMLKRSSRVLCSQQHPLFKDVLLLQCLKTVESGGIVCGKRWQGSRRSSYERLVPRSCPSRGNPSI